MPSGKIHSQDSIALAALTLALPFVTDLPFSISIPVAAGCVSGIILSPDLDQEGKTHSENVIFRMLKPLGVVFFLYWYTYAVIMPHRHFLSHFPVVGTLGRLMYLAPLWWLLFWRVGLDVPGWGVWWVAGLMLSDAVHWARDIS